MTSEQTEPPTKITIVKLEPNEAEKMLLGLQLLKRMIEHGKLDDLFENPDVIEPQPSECPLEKLQLKLK